MAYETELGNLIIKANAVSALIGEAFVNGSQGLSLVTTEVFPDDTNVIKCPISGYLVAETLAESTDYSYSANSELTDTSVTCTAKKAVIGSKITVEAARFGGGMAKLERFSAEFGRALARLFDADLKALFPSISTTVTASSTLVINNLIDARYNIVSAEKGAFSGKLVGMFDFKGIMELQKEIVATTASAFGNMELLGILGMPQPASGFAGSVMGIDLYQTDGLATSGGDDQACVWDPMQCFHAGVDGRNGVNNTLKDPAAINGLSTEILNWTFFKVIERRDLSGCMVKSDT
jgi:hypothetical protein